MEFSIEDSATKRIENLRAGGQTVDRGVHNLNSRNLLVAPCDDSDHVEAVYVDRFSLVKEKLNWSYLAAAPSAGPPSDLRRPFHALLAARSGLSNCAACALTFAMPRRGSD